MSYVIWLLIAVDGLYFNGVLIHQLTSTVDGKNRRMDLEIQMEAFGSDLTKSINLRRQGEGQCFVWR